MNVSLVTICVDTFLILFFSVDFSVDTVFIVLMSCFSLSCLTSLKEFLFFVMLFFSKISVFILSSGSVILFSGIIVVLCSILLILVVVSAAFIVDNPSNNTNNSINDNNIL